MFTGGRDHECVRIDPSDGFASIEAEDRSARQQSAHIELMDFKPTATGILDEDAARILHMPTPVWGDSARAIWPK
jgi:hypothetical protein